MPMPQIVKNPFHYIPIYEDIKSQFRFRHGRKDWGIPVTRDSLLPMQLPNFDNINDIKLIAQDGTAIYVFDPADWQTATGPDGSFQTWLGLPHGFDIPCGLYYIRFFTARVDRYYSEVLQLVDDHGSELAGLQVSNCGGGLFTITADDTLEGTIVNETIERYNGTAWVTIGTNTATLTQLGTPGGIGAHQVRRRITTTRGNVLESYYRLEFEVDTPCVDFQFELYDYNNHLRHPERFRLFWSNTNDMQDIPALYSTGYTQQAIIDGYIDFGEFSRDQETEIDGNGLERRISSNTKERYALEVPRLIEPQVAAMSVINDHDTITMEHQPSGNFYTLSEVEFTAQPMADGQLMIGRLTFLMHKTLNACEPGLDVSIV